MVMPAAKANALFDAKMAYWKATSGPAHHHVRSVGSHRIPVEVREGQTGCHRVPLGVTGCHWTKEGGERGL